MFDDSDRAGGIALWSLWELPSRAVRKLVRRGRPRGEPTAVRSIRLPVATWKWLAQGAANVPTSVNDLIRRRIG